MYSTFKTLRALKLIFFELSGNKNTGKLLSIYEIFSLDHANFSYDPSQILILQYPIPTASLPPSPSLPNFPLANWNPSSTQSSSCSSLFSLFFLTTFVHTPQLLNIPNHMPNQANQIYYQTIHKYTLPVKKLSL